MEQMTTHHASYRVSSRREKLQRLEAGAGPIPTPRERLLGAGLNEVDDLGVRLGSHGADF